VAKVESAWPRHPDYRIDIGSYSSPVRVWRGPLLLAETQRALLLEETGHKPVIYLPEADIRRSLFRPSDHHTVCPFKGEASYWSLNAEGIVEEDIAWYYPDPFPEVAAIAGHVAFYEDRVRVETRAPIQGASSD